MPANTETPVMTWQDQLKRNDVVSFYFPHEWPGSEPVKDRPGLVLDVSLVHGTPHALLAYGTGTGCTINKELVVHVTDASELNAASLKKPTKFNVGRRVLVPLRHSAFCYNGKLLTPVLGTLTGTAAVRAELMRTRARHLSYTGGPRRGPFGRRTPKKISGFSVTMVLGAEA